MSRNADWQDILSATQAMATAAQAGEWEEVTELESQRRAMLESFFAQPVSEADAPAVAEGIRAVMAIDQELMALCQEMKGVIAQQMGQLNQGRKAHTAYQQNR